MWRPLWPKSAAWPPLGARSSGWPIPNMAAAKAVGKIKEQIDLPLVVDIHFDYKLALECIEAGQTRSASTPATSAGPTG